MDSISCSIAVPEKILICVDLCVENESLVQSHVQGALRTFVKTKLDFNQAHSIALIGLENDKAIVLAQLTSNANVLIKCIDKLSFQNSRKEPFDINIVADTIKTFIDIETLELIPPYVYRAIMILNKSNQYVNQAFSMPAVCKNCFFMDLILINLSPEKSNENLEEDHTRKSWAMKSSSYLYEISSAEIELKKSCFQLLAHPFQRSPQHMANLDCKSIVERAANKHNK